jgi:hypothetical protein
MKCPQDLERFVFHNDHDQCDFPIYPEHHAYNANNAMQELDTTLHLERGFEYQQAITPSSSSATLQQIKDGSRLRLVKIISNVRMHIATIMPLIIHTIKGYIPI